MMCIVILVYIIYHLLLSNISRGLGDNPISE
jgi:hypothetical protein